MGEEQGNGLMYPSLDNIPGKIHPNTHTEQYLNSLVENIHRELQYIQGSPSVQMRHIPNGYLKVREEVDAQLREMEEENEAARRRREKNMGVRGEYRLT
jgi:histone deacetylase HOS2